MKSPGSEYQDALVCLYRDELSRRYSPDNLGHYKQFNQLGSAKVALLREFFLTHLYPDPTHRADRNLAFENLGVILRSPKKMFPMLGNAAGAILKFGFQFPAALKAGWRTLEIYIHSHNLESELLQIAQNNHITIDQIKEPQSLATLMRIIDRTKVERFRKDILKLFASLGNVKLLETTNEVMEHSLEIMHNHPDIYTQNERTGLGLGISMLKGGLKLFKSFSCHEIDMVIEGISNVEKDWYEGILATNHSL